MAAAPLLRSVTLAALLLAACCDASADPSSGAFAAEQQPDAPGSSAARTDDADPVTATAPAGPARPSECNAPKAERFVGRNADAATRAELAQAVAPTTTIRWVGPGDATTEDYSTSRLNVMLDVGGVIRSVHCG